jgi:hypothetical protein
MPGTETVLSKRSGPLYSILTRLFGGTHPGELEPPFTSPPLPLTINLEFERTRFRKYIVQDPNVFFTQTQRIALVADAVERTLVNSNDVVAKGAKLVKNHRDNEVSFVNSC